MRRFLRDIALFLGCLFLINMGLYRIADKLYFSDYRKYSLNYSKYLFADSRGQSLKSIPSQYGIYNFSAGSESYVDIKRKLNFLTARTNIDTIFLYVDDHALSQYRERANNVDRSLFYVTRSDYQNPLRYFADKVKSKIIFFQPQTRSVIRYFCFYKIQNAFHSPKSSRSWSEMSPTARRAHSQERLHAQNKIAQNSDILRESLQEIVSICQSKGITLIGIKFPLSREYVQALGEVSFGAAELLQQSGCAVRDFKTLFMEHDEYFVNQDHLNTEGGEVFAKIAFGSKFQNAIRK